jgi:hypothetical protein
LAGFVLVGEDFNQPLAICVNPTPIPHKHNTAEQTALDHEAAELPHQVELMGDLGSSGIFHSTDGLAYRSRWPRRRRKPARPHGLRSSPQAATGCRHIAQVTSATLQASLMNGVLMAQKRTFGLLPECARSSHSRSSRSEARLPVQGNVHNGKT